MAVLAVMHSCEGRSLPMCLACTPQHRFVSQPRQRLTLRGVSVGPGITLCAIGGTHVVRAGASRAGIAHSLARLVLVGASGAAHEECSVVSGAFAACRKAKRSRRSATPCTGAPRGAHTPQPHQGMQATLPVTLFEKEPGTL